MLQLSPKRPPPKGLPQCLLLQGTQWDVVVQSHKGVVVREWLGQEGRSVEVMEVRAVVARVGGNDTCGCEGAKQVPGKGEVVGKGDLSVSESSQQVPGKGGEKGGLVVEGENEGCEEKDVVGNGGRVGCGDSDGS